MRLRRFSPAFLSLSCLSSVLVLGGTLCLLESNLIDDGVTAKALASVSDVLVSLHGAQDVDVGLRVGRDRRDGHLGDALKSGDRPVAHVRVPGLTAAICRHRE